MKKTINYLKIIGKEILPPFLLNLYRFTRSDRSGYSGNFKSWSLARKESTGYGTQQILNKVLNSALKVKNGKAVFERDSAVFQKEEYSWPIVATLLWIAGQNSNKLHVIDFGGSLGSSYFQNRKFFSHLEKFQWDIVEQKHFVEAGKTNLADEHLRFFETIEECVADGSQAHVVIFSSVLQYLEEPYRQLEKVSTMRVANIIIDRTLFTENQEDFVAIQKVAPKVFDASLPVWIFNINRFKKLLSNEYSIVAEFDSLGGQMSVNKKTVKEKGLILKRR